MRLFVALGLWVIVGMGGESLLVAQAAAPSPPPAAGGETHVFGNLTPPQQLEYAQAHEKALADNPALEAENNALKERFSGVMVKGTPAEKQAMLQQLDSHRQKLRAAMLKVDSKLGPIFKQIDAQLSEAKAKANSAPH